MLTCLMRGFLCALLAVCAACSERDVLFPARPIDAAHVDVSTVNADLAVSYGFEEGSAAFTRDSHSGGDVAEFINGVSWSTNVPAKLGGKSKRSVVIAGGQYLRLPNDLGGLFKGSTTISLWLLTSAEGPTNSPTSAPAIVNLPSYGWGTLDSQGRVGLAIGSGETYSARINDGKWHHLVLVHANESKELKVYVDGVPSPPAMAQWDVDVRGVVNEVFRGNGGDSFVGSFDDFRIYTRALTPPEVTRLYAGDSF